MKINKKLLAKLLSVVTTAVLVFCMIYIIICIAQPAEKVILPENKTIIYDNAGSEYYTLSKYDRKTEEKIPVNIMRRFAGKEKSNVVS